MRAWKGIKALPPDDPNSFFMIGGFHGEPFRGAGWGSSSYWGGYCNHGNVLFPTWHRAYLLRLEQALQSIPGCEQVMLPFWDETSDESLTQGIPWALTDPEFELDGETIPNQLASFTFNRAITDFINGDDPNYSKPLPYVTVRYPLSGLVGTDEDRAATKEHNDKFPDPKENVMLLNRNIVDWLTSYIIVNGKVVLTNVKGKYEQCLDAPNYAVFSNGTSAAQWNNNLPAGATPIVPLESPLDPFKKIENGKERAYTSLDCINIEEQLGYTYGPGSLENLPKVSLSAAAVPAGNSSKVLRVSGLNRAPIRGSFLVSAYVNVDGERHLLGTESVLSRWSVQSCANCQTHLEVTAFFPLNQFAESSVKDAQYEVKVHTRDGVRHQTDPALQSAAGTVAQAAPKLFRVEVR
ncbi:tyrosinase [Burkholderia sp. SRS-46]|nr:tyrosinase [Burkholderia sp. SRS-46]